MDANRFKKTSIVHLLAEQVARHPEREALVKGSQRIRYRELWQQTVALSESLRHQGLQSGERVIVLMENSPTYVLAYYAVLMSGAVVVALNTGLKGQQLTQIIEHADAGLLLHDGKQPSLSASLPEGLDALDATALLDELLAADAVAESPALLKRVAEGDQLSSIIYTSGTTGRPKGVMLSAANLLANTLAIVDYLQLAHSDKTLCVLPFYYAYGNSVLHTHLAAGACLVLENSLMYPQQILEQMAREGVTGFAGVPSTFRLLLLRCDLGKYPLPQLRYLSQAGGALAPADIERVRQSWPHARFFVMYGQTEATSRLTYLPPERLADKANTVGLPLRGISLQIMDEEGRPKPRGESGEICVSGPNIMLGYWRDDAATAGKFFGPWMRTGDLGFVDDEGFLTVLGRRSDMIKSGDHRIAPEEIEQVIAALDSVEEVAVVGVPDKLLGQVIKAYVVLAANSALQSRDVLRHCKQQCAHYKVPRMVEFLPELPKTASGKIQRFKLQQVAELATNCV